MRVLVTGGAGFIGSHLVDALVNEGCSVRIIDNFCTGSELNIATHRKKIEIINGDVADPNAVRGVCADVDILFHLAGIPDVQSSISNPKATQLAGEAATLLLLTDAVASNVQRFLFSSSCSVYGRSDRIPIPEAAKSRPLSPYAASKVASEGYLSAFSECHGIDTVALRYFNVFGPRQNQGSSYPSVLFTFLSEIIRGRQPIIFGDGEQTRDFVFISDAVNASLLAMRCPGRFNGQPFNIGSGRGYTLNDIVDTLNELLGTNVTPIYKSARPGDIQRSQADIALARASLGYIPETDLRSGLGEFIRDIQSRPAIDHLQQS